MRKDQGLGGEHSKKNAKKKKSHFQKYFTIEDFEVS